MTRATRTGGIATFTRRVALRAVLTAVAAGGDTRTLVVIVLSMVWEGECCDASMGREGTKEQRGSEGSEAEGLGHVHELFGLRSTRSLLNPPPSTF